MVMASPEVFQDQSDKGSVTSTIPSVDQKECSSTICPVCEEEYKDPKILPCAHRLCRKCLVTWLTTSTATPSCPLCRRKIANENPRNTVAKAVNIPQTENLTLQVPTTSKVKAGSSVRQKPSQGQVNVDAAADAVSAVVDDLPTDVVLACLVACKQKLRPPVFCDVCDGREAADNFCLQCEERLCKTCFRYHSRMAGTRNHVVKDIHSLTPEQLAFSKQEMCAVHADQYLDVYCASHRQVLCFKCFSADHRSCTAMESVADVAKRQREVVQTQVDKLTQAVADVKRRQFVYADSQKKCNTDVSTLTTRLTEAVRAREKQLRTQIAGMPMPLQQELQNKGRDVEDWQILATANRTLVSDMLLSASDVNILRLSGILSARMARLTADVTRAVETTYQRVAVGVDQYDLLKVEELLRSLGTVEIVQPKQTQEPASVVPPAKPTTKGAVGQKELRSDCARRVFTAKDLGYILIKGMPWIRHLDKMIICKADCVTVVLTDGDRSVVLMKTFHPYAQRKIATLTCTLRAMANLQEGLVVATTDTKSMYLIDITRDPAGFTRVPVPNLYSAVAPGLNDTIIVSPDNEVNTLDVISREGHLLKTIPFTPNIIESPSAMCRMKDDLLLSQRNKSAILKIGLNSRASKELYYGCPGGSNGCLFVDHLNSLYAVGDYTTVFVMDTLGEWQKLYMINCGSIVVTAEGTAFSFHASPGGTDIPLIVYSLSNE